MARLWRERLWEKEGFKATVQSATVPLPLAKKGERENMNIMTVRKEGWKRRPSDSDSGMEARWKYAGYILVKAEWSKIQVRQWAEAQHRIIANEVRHARVAESREFYAQVCAFFMLLHFSLLQ